jgi:hypothetical protein
MIKEDKSMAEIHEIMARLSHKRIGMTMDEIVKDIGEGAEGIKKKYKVKLRTAQYREKKLTVQ